jgi:hypothetical protein
MSCGLISWSIALRQAGVGGVEPAAYGGRDRSNSLGTSDGGVVVWMRASIGQTIAVVAKNTPLGRCVFCYHQIGKHLSFYSYSRPVDDPHGNSKRPSSNRELSLDFAQNGLAFSEKCVT